MILETDQSAVGRRVVALNSGVRALKPGFPGWQHPDYESYLVETPAGLAGTINNVESHGMNPWTRYGVTWEDGTKASGLVLGRDFKLV